MQNEKFFKLVGTKCQSCEILIEKAVNELPGVEKSQAAHNKHALGIRLHKGFTYQAAQLNQVLEPLGYQVIDPEQAGETPAPRSFSWQRFGGLLIVILGLYLLLDKIGLLRLSPGTAEPAGLAAIFSIGLIASVSSCTAVLGGLLAAVSANLAKRQPNASAGKRIWPHLLFNTGRLIGFAVFGALLGLIGSAIHLSGFANGLMVLVIALVMIILGANLLELLPASGLKLIPKSLSHKIHKLAEADRPATALSLGALTFFLPCGFTQSIQLYALTLGNPWSASLVMVIFALGTMPALLGIGTVSSLAKGRTLARVTKAAGALVIVLGLSNLGNGLALLGFNPSLAQASDATVSQVTDEVQVIKMDVTSRGTYEPDVLSVRAGIPVEWQIHGADFMGCGNSLILRNFGVSTYLKPGDNLVRFTPDKAGRYTFSCSMGMIRGTMIVTES